MGIAPDAGRAECRRLGEKLARLAPRVALLAMGDGPGAGPAPPRTPPTPTPTATTTRWPGPWPPPTPAALAALDPGQDGPLVIAGRAAWQVLAGAAGQDAFTAELRYRGVPFEVSYFVASWRRAH